MEKDEQFRSFIRQWGLQVDKHPYFAYPAYPQTISLPDQGFKLHVSATIVNAKSVAEKVVPYLLDRNIEFKILKDLFTLSDFNRGVHGYSQIGKFITIYPRNEEDLVAIATELKERTRGYTGPVIPSDHRLGDILYYRYGSFIARNRSNQKAYILDPEGKQVEDERKKETAVPSWVTDPVAEMKYPPSKAPLPSRYFVASILKRSGKGSVYQVLDFTSLPPNLRIMKEAVPYGNMEITGTDAIARLKWESRLLHELAPLHPSYPRIVDEFQCGKHWFVIMENRGKSLKELVKEKGPLSLFLAMEIILQLCKAVQVAHRRDIILRDLSLDNVLWDGRQVSIIDLEYAYRSDGPELDPVGTPGFSVKEQMNVRIPPLRPLPIHDIYSIGAIWHTLLAPQKYLEFLQSKPSLSKRNQAWERSELPDEVPHKCRKIIQRCLDTSGGHCYSDVRSLIDDVRALKGEVHPDEIRIIP